MTPTRFQQILKKRLTSIEKTLGKKAKEYAQEKDRLWNFKRAAEMNATTPAEALWGMAMKHFVSVDDMVKGRLEISDETINAKIGDFINYAILLESVLKENIDAKKKSIKSKQPKKRKTQKENTQTENKSINQKTSSNIKNFKDDNADVSGFEGVV